MPNRGLKENIFKSAIPKEQTNIAMTKNQNPIIRNAGMFLEPTQPSQLNISSINESMPEPQNDDSSRFLGSLIAQGAAGFGTGLMGGSAADIQRSAGQFQTMRDTQDNQKKAKLLVDPTSEESKRKREVYKSLGYQVPDNLSATDLNDPTVLQTLKSRMQEQKLAAMPRGGIGVSGAKPEKEIKSDKKLVDEYGKHAESLQASINTMEAANKLNRTRIGGVTPDFSNETIVQAGNMNREAQGIIKVLAGPGTLSDSDIKRLSPLVANSDMNRELATETIKSQTIEGLKKAIASLNFDKDLGRVSESDYNKIINQYNKYLKNQSLGLNLLIDNNGELTQNSKKTQSNNIIVTDKQTGKKFEVDQEGNVIKEL